MTMAKMGREPVPEDMPAVNDLVDEPTPQKTLPLIIVVVGVAAIVITAAWIALLGYGFWWLIDWAVG